MKDGVADATRGGQVPKVQSGPRLFVSYVAVVTLRCNGCRLSRRGSGCQRMDHKVKSCRTIMLCAKYHEHIDRRVRIAAAPFV